jgi:hypothetical protein
MSGFNMPPGCSPSDIPGNDSQESIDKVAADIIAAILAEITEVDLSFARMKQLQQVVINILEGKEIFE